ncbi:MAG: glycoside hydrolase family 127 protein [Bifidobacteriaceae bacterium]|jgi:DUF1680 family protein|nr:glycoside hydrolase family 127 protein [Bifidobacteriaceae bacterium]
MRLDIRFDGAAQGGSPPPVARRVTERSGAPTSSAWGLADVPASARRASLPLTDVVIEDVFWTPRRETVRRSTLPYQLERLRTGGQFNALRLAWRPGDPNEPHPFWDSDVAKWIEAASYWLATDPDPELDAAVDEAINLLAGAQQPDGYLDSYFMCVRPDRQFTDLQDAHELYCAGHLIEAGVAHHRATGKTSLLDVVTKLADLIDRETLPGGRIEGGMPGHPEIELALVKLAAATGNRKYLDLSARLVDNRGKQPNYFDMERERRGDEGWADQWLPDRPRNRERYREYNQTHRPVREQREVVGHSVRAMYLYCAMADLALELGDDSLREACEALWEDLEAHKLYITGALGSDGSIEGFGPAYDLPDHGSYAETCASIGLVFWAHRMMLLTGEGRYIDTLERSLYNGVIGGVSLDGTRFFYRNPLASDGDKAREGWFEVACCPPNYARLMTSLSDYLYVRDEEGIYVNLYASSSAAVTVAGNRFTVTQRTEYPWDGKIAVSVRPHDSGRLSLRLRLPAWAQEARLTVDGVPCEAEPVDGYLVVDREWEGETTVVLDLGMAAQLVYPNPRVDATLGRVAVQRGPLVYAFEECDNPAEIRRLSLVGGTPLVVEQNAALGMVGIRAEGVALAEQNQLYSSVCPYRDRVSLKAIPYFAWGNRGLGQMAVWLPVTGCADTQSPEVLAHAARDRIGA